MAPWIGRDFLYRRWLYITSECSSIYHKLLSAVPDGTVNTPDDSQVILKDAAARSEYVDSKTLEQQEAACIGTLKPYASIASESHLSVSDLLDTVSNAQFKKKKKKNRTKSRGKPIQSQWDAPMDEFTKDTNLSPSNNDEKQASEPEEKGESNARDVVPNKSKDDVIALSAEDQTDVSEVSLPDNKEEEVAAAVDTSKQDAPDEQVSEESDNMEEEGWQEVVPRGRSSNAGGRKSGLKKPSFPRLNITQANDTFNNSDPTCNRVNNLNINGNSSASKRKIMSSGAGNNFPFQRNASADTSIARKLVKASTFNGRPMPSVKYSTCTDTQLVSSSSKSAPTNPAITNPSKLGNDVEGKPVSKPTQQTAPPKTTVPVYSKISSTTTATNSLNSLITPFPGKGPSYKEVALAPPGSKVMAGNLNVVEEDEQPTSDESHSGEAGSPHSQESSKKLSAADLPFNPGMSAPKIPIFGTIAVTPFKDGRASDPGGILPRPLMIPPVSNTMAAVTPIRKSPHQSPATRVPYGPCFSGHDRLYPCSPRNRPQYMPNGEQTTEGNSLNVPCKIMNPDAPEFVPGKAWQQSQSTPPPVISPRQTNSLDDDTEAQRDDSEKSPVCEIVTTDVPEVISNKVEVATIPKQNRSEDTLDGTVLIEKNEAVLKNREDNEEKDNDSCKIDFKHDETQEQRLPNVSQDSIQQKTDPDEKKYHDSGIKLPVSTVLKSTSWADCVRSESETEVDDALDPVKGDSAVVAILYTNKGSNSTSSQFSGSETSTEEASRKNHFGSSQLECSNGQTTEQIKQTDDEKSPNEEPLAENGHNLSECSESSDNGSGEGGAINKNKPRDRDGFTLVTKRKRNYRNHEFKNPTKSVYKQQPNGS